MKLLSPANTNAKTAKNGQFSEYLSAILHLAPFNLSGYQVCPAASKGCSMACLNTAGRGRFNNVQNARIKKTKLFFTDPVNFMAQLIKDIQALDKKAKKQNKKTVIRLNGTSDIAWENFEAKDGLNIFELFPHIQFYDYSKRPDRILNNDNSNYHLTFSRSEVNETIVKRILAKGFNAAIVFNKLPEYWNGYKVIDGNTHDLRFLDMTNCVVGLTPKGKAKKDTTGFVKNAV